jgi:peptidoglycan/LPS O-acetylase OafA/YrhL
MTDQSHDRKRGLDTLRSVAIFVVILWHFQSKATFEILKAIGHFGWAGVDLFFVLSGYLIGGQLFRSMQRTGDISLSSFYTRRAFRILPCFLAVLAVYILWPGFSENTWKVPVWRFLTFTQNFGLHHSAFSHAWSLCIEEQFYWLFPLCVLFMSRRRRLVLLTVIAVVFAGMLVRGLLWSNVLALHPTQKDLNVAYYQWIYYPTFSRLDGLTVGVSIALIEVFVPHLWDKIKAWGNAIALLGVALVGLALMLFEHNQYAVSTVVFGFPVLALGCGCWIASAAGELSLLARVPVPGTGILATLAYSIYLTHKQVIHLLLPWIKEHAWASTPYASFCIYTAAIGCAGLALHLSIERPFLWLRDRNRQNAPETKLALGVGESA